MAPLRMLEFYSGIGGMHYAASLAGWDFQVVKAFDINDVANNIYRHNFGGNTVAQRQIEALEVKQYEKYAADIWTMSPPCQPYTRTGLQQGSLDARSRSFLYLMRVLREMTVRPSYILVENVKGFEESDSRDILVDTLKACGYQFQEFLLTPLQLGIPNSRMRYYLLAKSNTLTFAHPPTGTILGFVPFSRYMSTEFVDNRATDLKDEGNLLHASNTADPIQPIIDFLEPNLGEEENKYMIPEKTLLNHGHAFDIVRPSSRRSCCFTKGYYHFVEATGSILQLNEDLNTEETFRLAQDAKQSGDSIMQKQTLEPLKLRYFTPREVANLMGFPDSFGFPETTTLKQRYRTLGNSINVRLVAELMKYLMLEKPAE
ncbi:hypothetical protein VTP01DRAFT_10848 [Rhizomucor pusillus]|uniref:uncharacterized protein n=1 Tax=Rhizomucor pusillus TaxID=4840 RepID=UPI003742EFCF